MATIQTTAVLEALAARGHATNMELHLALSETLPELSLQSLHRITARLHEQGIIGLVPSSSGKAILDIRPETHDHFTCRKCGGVVDIVIPSEALEEIQNQLGTNLIDSGLVVRGTCAVCRTQQQLNEESA